MVSDEPQDGRCNAETSGGYCEGWQMDNGRCWNHGGRNEDDDRDAGGAPEGNDNAVTHGAWSKSFVTDFLTDEEIERVRQFEELADSPDGAQDMARTAAGIALEQFRRSGDERFLRRFESICDTFGIAPTDELDVNVSGGIDLWQQSAKEDA